jgi:hypothetical protein
VTTFGREKMSQSLAMNGDLDSGQVSNRSSRDVIANRIDIAGLIDD